MPTFGHVFYGLCLLIPILYFARDKFNYKIAFIFLANQIYGPDVVFLGFGTTPFHGILGFALLAILLSRVYSYASKFSLQKSEAGFPLRFEDGGIREVSWKNAYLVTLAGGISHFFIDQFFHIEQEMWLFTWPILDININITYSNMLLWDGPLSTYHSFEPLMVIGEIIVVVTILLSMWYFRKGFKNSIIVFAIASAITICVMLLGVLGIDGLTAIFSGERELAVICFGAVYIFAPLMMIMYVARDVQDHPVQTPDQPKRSTEKRLKKVALIGVIVGAFFLLYGSLAILIADTLAGLIASKTGTVASVNSIQFLGAYYACIAGVLLVGSIGLFFRSRICRYIAIAASLYFIILGFPLAIALFLCEKDVKALFAQKPRE